MPNPNRPNDGETIAGEWGQLTADRVVRRYRSRADRDVDMAGVGDVTGQLVVIAPVGVFPWFEQHDGSGWRRVQGGPLIGGELACPFPFLPPSDGFTVPQVVNWLSGGMVAFGSDDWNFVGDRRLLVVPQPGFYRVAGSLVCYNHGLTAQWLNANISRVLPINDAGYLNNPLMRRTGAMGGNPNVVYIWMVSAFSALVACNAGDGLTLTPQYGPVPGMTVETSSFSATFEADLPPGYVVPPLPLPTGPPTAMPPPTAPEQLPGREDMEPRPPWPNVPDD